MSAVPSSVRVGRPLRAPGAAAWGGAFVALWIAAGLLTVRQPFAARLILGVAVVASYFVVALSSRDLAVLMVFVWLPFMGFVRRALIPFVGYPQFDPLLLLGPICAIILWLTARGQRVPRTALSSLAVVLFGIAIAQIVNPSAANAAAGPLGALFWIGPLLWFFVGRTLTEAQMAKVFRLITILLVPISLHGLYQSFNHFLPFEYTWIGVSGFGPAIFLDGFKIRPFSTLGSPQEYGYFLAFGLIVLWARILAEPKGRTWKLGLFLLGGTALFLQAGRTVFAFFVLGFLMTSVQRVRARGGRMLAMGVIGLAGIFLTMNAARPAGPRLSDPTRPAATGIGSNVQHQVSGFTDPSNSTLPLHQQLIREGFEEALDDPFGKGTGFTSLAVKKVEGARGQTTENDVSTTFLALGIAGGLLYAIFMIAAFRAAVRRSRRRMSFVSLGALGVLVAFLTQWYAGQMYAASSLLWLTLGWLGRPIDDA